MAFIDLCSWKPQYKRISSRNVFFFLSHSRRKGSGICGQDRRLRLPFLRCLLSFFAVKQATGINRHPGTTRQHGGACFGAAALLAIGYLVYKQCKSGSFAPNSFPKSRLQNKKAFS